MSASLVGSEMCIRDSLPRQGTGGGTGTRSGPAVRGCVARLRFVLWGRPRARRVGTIAGHMASPAHPVMGGG
eukprot:3249878-Alexandrium_andersonii.AAC.1